MRSRPARGKPPQNHVPDVSAPSAWGLSDERSSLLRDVFELFPSGIAVAGPNGAILTWNRALVDLLALGDRLDGRRCCELFGCRCPGGPLEGVCLTEAALDAGCQVPEVDVRPPAGGDPLCVTAAPLRTDLVRVVFQVRAAAQGELGDGVVPQLRVSTLGRMRLDGPDGSLTGEWLEQRPGQLLKFLVAERHRVVATEEIAEAVWPNPRTATPNTVRHFVHALRERLEPERLPHHPSSFVVARRGGYTLNDATVWIDADEFEASIHRGLAALADGRRGAAVDQLEHALSLYRGDFLADLPYAEWALPERERLRGLAEQPLRLLSELRADDPHAAARYLERLAELEPLDHAVQRQLLALWVRQGRLSRAARHYHAFELRLLREFGEVPDFRLCELTEAGRERRRAGR